MVFIMFKKPKNIKKQTKEILNDMEYKFYSYDKVYIIHECDNTFTLKLVNVNKEYRILNQMVLIELIPIINEYKTIEFQLSEYLNKLVLG